MQETEINFNLDHSLLTFSGYVIETERNSGSSRTAIHINSEINFVRRLNLEGVDSNMVVIDLKGQSNYMIINKYRSLSPLHNISQREKFNYQLNIINQAITSNTIVIGDFNLDYS